MLAGPIARVINWLDNMESAHVLHGLDGQMLADMGIARDEIARSVAGPSTGPSFAGCPEERPKELGGAELD